MPACCSVLGWLVLSCTCYSQLSQTSPSWAVCSDASLHWIHLQLSPPKLLLSNFYQKSHLLSQQQVLLQPLVVHLNGLAVEHLPELALDLGGSNSCWMLFLLHCYCSALLGHPVVAASQIFAANLSDRMKNEIHLISFCFAAVIQRCRFLSPSLGFLWLQ